MITHLLEGITKGVLRETPRWLLSVGAMVVLAQGGCVTPGTVERAAAPFFATFQYGERTGCCGLALMNAGSIVAVGRADTVAGKSWAWVSRFSGAGALEWTREWAPEFYSDLSAAVEIQDGAIVATGSTVAAARLVGLIVRIEPTGAVGWTRTLGLAKGTEVRGVVPDGAGGVVMAGSFEHQPNRWTLFVAPVTTQGDIGKPIVVGEGRVRDVIRFTERGYGVISDAEEVIRLDEAMRLQWRRHIEGASAAMGLDDGSIVLVGATTRDRTETRLLRLNSQGEVLWDRRWSPGLCPGPAIAIWRWQDDGMIVAGDSCDGSDSIVLVITTASGEPRVIRRLPIRPRTTAAVLRRASTGSIVAAGMFLQDDSPDAVRGWVFRSEPIFLIDPP